MPHAMALFKFMMLNLFSSLFNAMPILTLRQTLLVLKIN